VFYSGLSEEETEASSLKEDWREENYSPGEDVVESWCKEAVADQLALSIMWHSKKLKEQLGLINPVLWNNLRNI
jgi:hypothetical protein